MTPEERERARPHLQRLGELLRGLNQHISPSAEIMHGTDASR